MGATDERPAEELPGAPHHVRVEHLDEPIGLTVARPRLSWRLPDGWDRQTAYQLRVGDWLSPWVTSERHVLVHHDAPPAQSRQRTTWQVRVRRDLESSAWSAPATYEHGLLHADDWSARWISPQEPEIAPPGERPVYVLRREFDVPGAVAGARLYATALGLYEAHLNGCRVGDRELTPGYTDYRRRLHVQVYDIGGMLVRGPNAIALSLSDGWYRGQLGMFQQPDCYGTRTSALAQMEIRLADGRAVTVGTDEQWSGVVGEVLRADLVAGETVDARRRRPWSVVGGAPGRDLSPVAVVRPVVGALESSPAPPTRITEEITPVVVDELAGSRCTVDLGQNINGWLALTIGAPPDADRTVTVTYGEVLGADGVVDQGHLMPRRRSGDRPPTAGQQDTFVVGAGTTTGFEPRHSTRGFRYATLSGVRRGELSGVTGKVVHSDLRRTGWFRCSDPRVDRLVEAVAWTLRDNVCEIPTDCPTRERAGWTGDWQIAVDMAAYLFDVAGFTTKWLSDLRGEQLADGNVPSQVPGAYLDADELFRAVHGAAGWGDAAVLVPWQIYRHYGDDGLLAESWPSMCAWVDYAAGQAASARHPERIARRPQPAEHERYLWDTGFHWGEWLEPGVELRITDQFSADSSVVATAYLSHSARILANAAEVLGRRDEATRYHTLAERAASAWCTEHLGADGLPGDARQATLVRALAFGLVGEPGRGRLADELVRLIRAAGTRVGTGFLSTGLLLPALADAGHGRLAIELLTGTEAPSWLAMLDRQATTMWELWDGIDEHGHAHGSLNHYSKGAVVGFLFSHVAGIRPVEPGFCTFEVAPLVDGGLTFAEARLETPYGEIRTAWHHVGVEDREVDVELAVPAGTTCRLRVGPTDTLLGPGGHRLRVQAPAP